MQNRKQIWTATFAALGMLVMILDANTAINGAKDGVEICLKSVLPSLFPFMFLCAYITKSFSGVRIPMSKSLYKLIKLPQGAETLFLTGILGGYPVGAQSVVQAFRSGKINKSEAEFLLGFCNNAGPSFIFGMSAAMFSYRGAGWYLWLMQIISAICVSFLLPCPTQKKTIISVNRTDNDLNVFQNSLRAIAMVCGWVILFRVLLAFLQRWFLWIFPAELQTLIIGLLELVNGCFALKNIHFEGIRFILCSLMLSFGGICVTMQTISVCSELGISYYLRGKVIQSLISTYLAYLIQGIIFPQEGKVAINIVVLILAPIVFAFIAGINTRRKKVVAICS